MTTTAQPRRHGNRPPTRAASHQLLVEWNDTGRAGASSSFLELFDARAASTPGAVAVSDGYRQLTYLELSRRAGRLATELRRVGVGPEISVGLLLESSLELVVAAIGILQAGGVYVPLDPAYPDSRLAFMIADAGIAQIVTRKDLRPRIPVDAEVGILDVGSAWSRPCVREVAVREVAPETEPRNAAYVVYTSGSTGRPKGVVIPLGALGWYCAAAIGHYRIRPGDRLLQLASISFDISIGEIFPCLAAGATLVLQGAGGDFFARCRRQAVTVLFPPTALWQGLAELAEVDPDAVPPTLRLVSFGGERVLGRRIEAWQQSVGRRIRLVNGYGPTETTVEASLYELTAAPAGAGSRIGRPLVNTRLYVLGPDLRPVGAGAAGELAIAGEGLARGYLGRPAATARRFVPDPFAPEPGGRLYSTGDRTRWRPDGELEILGRFDQQIKVRGFRVEPEEIEKELGRHPLVRNAIVVARGEQSNSRLVAYIVTASAEIPDAARETPGPGDEAGPGRYLGGTGILGVGGSSDSRRPDAWRPDAWRPGAWRPGAWRPGQTEQAWAAELRRFLADRLPDYMVPSRFVRVEDLPLTPNGKIDRDRLAAAPAVDAIDRIAGRCASGPMPELAGANGNRPASRPRGTIEQTLTRIWQQVLRTERIARDDDFFQLGGDSILAIQIVTRAYREGLRVTPEEVFEHPTITALAAVATADTAAGNGVDPSPVTGPAPLTPVQCWFFHDAELPEPRHFNQSMMLEVRRPLKPSALWRTVELLLGQHDALRARFERWNGGWRQVFTDCRSAAPVTIIDLSRLEDRDRRIALAAAASRLQTSLDHQRGPLLRLAYFDLGGQAPRILIPIHHLVVDAVSWSILLADLERTYLRLERGEEPELPPKTTSYQAWAELQAAYAGSPELRRELAFWVTPSRSSTPLPRDFPAGRNTVSSAAAVAVALDPEATRRLLRQVPAAYRTRIDDLLLTALGRTLGAWAGPLRLDLESHGREGAFGDVDLSRTVGWFTSTFPVFLDVDGDDLGESLIAVKEQLRQIPRRGIGYGVLRYLAGEPRLPAPAELCFNYLGQLDSLLACSELFAPATEARGRETSRRGKRSYVLEIDGGVVDDRLWINWHFSRNLHRRSTIEQLAATFRSELEALIEHCLSPGAGGVTPSDLPLARLDRGQLERLIAGREIEDVYPLSPMQEGMLFHTLYAPDTAVYFEQSSWAIEGDLDAGAFRHAWERLVERHAILRTSFAWQDLERPLQLVHRRAQAPWRFEDWRGLRPARRQARSSALFRDDRARGFDVSRTPLLRFTLARLGERSYRFLWSIHHLLLDGWSIAALFEELFEIYAALREAREPRLPARRPLRDFVAWLEGRDLAAAEDFWRRELAGFTAPTPLAATSRSAPGTEVVERRQRLGTGLTAALERFARDHRLTLSTLFQGAWALVLARLAGVSEVVFGATVSGRPATLRDSDSIIGLLINTLPVRVEVRARQHLLSWLARLQKRGARLRRHQHSPLVEVQAWSDVPQHLPLFESLLVFENYPAEVALEAEQERAGLSIGDFRGYSQTNYPLTLSVLPGADLTLEASVDPGRFEAAAAARLLRHLRAALTGMIAHPGCRLGEISMLSAAERHQLLIEWNDRDIGPTPGPATVHRRFEAQVEQTPDAIALVVVMASGVERTLTYEGLDRRADRLAHGLIDRGIALESRVALALDSIDMVIAILAVLKAGGAYVPVDPTQPSGRLRSILDSSRAELMVTRGPLPSPIPILDLDEHHQAWRADDLRGAPRRQTRTQNLAYILHTSGSTGTPKGVMVSHGALVETLAAWQRAYRLRDVARRHLQVASFTFDVASGDLLRALGTGATLVLCPRDDLITPRLLHGLLLRQRLDCVELVPALADLLARHLESASSALETMRLLAVGSDSWSMTDLHRLQQRAGPRARVVSSYGVTEAAIDSTYFDPATAGALASDRSVPIGRPFAGTRVYLLDRSAPVPVGVPGELHLGGGLARGYVGQPAATAARFVPDPFSSVAGARLYRTGDRVRYLADGNLEFLGRLDHQVKIRGFRIEPGEVEAALRRHPEVLDAAVVAREPTGGERLLTAFVVARTDRTDHDLRNFLAGQLPAPMVPSFFVNLEALPVNRNGKVDRAALGRAALDRGTKLLDTAHEAPATATERALAEIWSEVLGVEQIGRHDDFFALGGHSLRAVRLMVEIERRFEIRFSLATLFLEPTLAGLARRIGDRVPEPERRALVEIARGNGAPPFFCVHPVGGNILCYADLARHLCDHPFYGLQSPGRAGQPLFAGVEAMARHYLEAIRGRQPRGPYLLGGWSMGGVVAFEIARQLRALGAPIGALTLIDCAAPGSASAAATGAEPSLQAFASDLGLRNDFAHADRSEGQGLQRILELCQRHGLLGSDLGLAELERIYRRFESNDRAMKCYRPRKYSGRLTLLRSADWTGDPTLGWSAVAREVEVRWIDGDHYSMVREPRVRELAAVLREELLAAVPGSSYDDSIGPRSNHETPELLNSL